MRRPLSSCRLRRRPDLRRSGLDLWESNTTATASLPNAKVATSNFANERTTRATGIFPGVGPPANALPNTMISSSTAKVVVLDASYRPQFGRLKARASGSQLILRYQRATVRSPSYALRSTFRFRQRRSRPRSPLERKARFATSCPTSALCDTPITSAVKRGRLSLKKHGDSIWKG